jgi:hypothetical protein
MATIKINNINAPGSDLFNDSESYLDDLTDDEMSLTQGGSSIICYYGIVGSMYAARSSIGCANAAAAVIRFGYDQGKKRKWW